MSSRFRRHGEPRPFAFLTTGAILGLLVGIAIYLANPDNGDYSARTALGYLGVFGALIGALLGGVAAAVLSKRN